MDDHSEEFARYLETLTPLLDAMKRKSIDMLRLRSGASALDVGCGLGRDAEMILDEVGSAGRVVGVDAAKQLIAKAIERTRAMAPRPEFCVGDVLALEFPDGTFDACRADRVLQHLRDPAQAVAEMVRVTRPGGRVGLLEPDWYTFTIAGGDVTVAQKVIEYYARVSTSQGDIGRRLVQLLLEANCTDVTVDAEVLLFRELDVADFVLHIRSTLETAMADRQIARDVGDTWWNAVRQLDAQGGFVATVNGVICAGTVR
jgi:ubiquinone/menaquinone biosynthesis C-methylase UbiE